ncbi:MAG: CPBP family intramembrane metalloprotease [Clostridiales bacterium]|nr:CPBP family intramembrane metalloprotease [Clostridiales bacterium]
MDPYDYYKEFSSEGSKVGKLMLLHQGIFQFGTVAVVFILLLIAGLFAGLRTGSYSASAFKDADVSQLCTYLGSAIMQLIAGICFIVFYVKNKERIRSAPLAGGRLSLWLLIRCWFYITASCLVIIGGKLFLQAALRMQIGDTMLRDTKYPVAVFILGSVFPAIAEELAFRGVLFRYLRKHGFFYAALITSIIFGLCHMNLIQTVFTTVLGLVLCYVYERSGHIWTCMLLHFVHNATVLLFTLIEDQTMLLLPLCLLGFNCFVVLILLFIFRFKPSIKADRIAIKKTLTAIPMMVLICVIVFFCILKVLFRF